MKISSVDFLTSMVGILIFFREWRVGVLVFLREWRGDFAYQLENMETQLENRRKINCTSHSVIDWSIYLGTFFFSFFDRQSIYLALNFLIPFSLGPCIMEASIFVKGTLLKIILSSILIYVMSFVILTKKVSNKLERIQRDFLLGEGL